MRILRQWLTPLVLVLVTSGLAAGEDRHAVDSASLADAVTAHVTQDVAQRAAVREALARPEVRDVAAKSGVDLNRLEASIDSLQGSALATAAAAAGDLNGGLVGGASTIVISSTTIIIVLLVIILVAVA